MSTPVSPADRYAAARRQRAEDSPGLSAFLALYDFEFDDFQLRACRALDGGHGVLLAAPTGSGKTVVGEFAVHLALAEGRKCFYTTPIKALSNQKYADLVRRYSAASVGLLTGDNSINGEAPVVVMTTEVLRNMLYAGSPTLGSLGYVVLDEVHYLADRFRGAVWEEVIIHLPESVRLVALSATVSNAEEFGDWLAQVRGGTTVIVDEHRPVPLWQHMLAGGRLYDLFVTDHDQPAVAAGPPDGRGAPGEGGRTGGRGAPARPARGTSRPRAMVNPELLRIAQREQWAARKGPGRPGRGGRRPPRFRGTSRPDVIGRLDAAGLLPAITFIFSRAGCDAAVQQCLAAGLRLTTPEEAAEITALAERHTADIPLEALPVLGYGEWLLGLQRGIAAHHAGLLPTFKQVVEELFTAGLVRAVFATETLALGINMPARTVVIERLDKWNGETHADLTPGEYTQLTGRAGRRGIDVEGHAVVLWQPGDDPAAVAGLAGTRTYPLSSSFRPSYNMAVNLVGQVGREQASALLESSFAQFQADRAVAGIARQARRSRKSMAEAAVSCHLGDFDEYIAIRRELSQREGDQARRRSCAPCSSFGAVTSSGSPAAGGPGSPSSSTRSRAAATSRCRSSSPRIVRSSSSPRPTSRFRWLPSSGSGYPRPSASGPRITGVTSLRPCVTGWWGLISAGCPGTPLAVPAARTVQAGRAARTVQAVPGGPVCASTPVMAARTATSTPGRLSSTCEYSGRPSCWSARSPAAAMSSRGPLTRYAPS